MLFRYWRGTKQLVIPVSLRANVLKIAHDVPTAGHLGRKKTEARILRRFYWPGVFRDVKTYVQSCEACQKIAPRLLAEPAKLRPLPIIE